MCYEIYCRSFKARDEQFANGGAAQKPQTGKDRLLADVEVKLEKINKRLDDIKSNENRTILNAKRHFFEAIKNELIGQGHLNADYQSQSKYFKDGGELDEASKVARKKPAGAVPPHEKPLDRPVKDVKVKKARNIKVDDEEESEPEEDLVDDGIDPVEEDEDDK